MTFNNPLSTHRTDIRIGAGAFSPLCNFSKSQNSNDHTSLRQRLLRCGGVRKSFFALVTHLLICQFCARTGEFTSGSSSRCWPNLQPRHRFLKNTRLFVAACTKALRHTYAPRGRLLSAVTKLHKNRAMQTIPVQRLNQIFLMKYTV